MINFSKPVVINKIEIKFQGGFCSSIFQLESIDRDDTNKIVSYNKIIDFYPEDVNSSQVYKSFF
jgi:hypothetical protein